MSKYVVLAESCRALLVFNYQCALCAFLHVWYRATMWQRVRSKTIDLCLIKMSNTDAQFRRGVRECDAAWQAQEGKIWLDKKFESEVW